MMMKSKQKILLEFILKMKKIHLKIQDIETWRITGEITVKDIYDRRGLMVLLHYPELLYKLIIFFS